MAIAKIMFSLPPSLLEAIDHAANEEQRSRSELLRDAARLYLQRRQARSRPGDDPIVRRAVSIQDAIAQHDTVPWDGVAEIRRWRTEH
jgi:metal-responsive CopG/Arc/MetJ family transcriptional regulator